MPPLPPLMTHAPPPMTHAPPPLTELAGRGVRGGAGLRVQVQERPPQQLAHRVPGRVLCISPGAVAACSGCSAGSSSLAHRVPGRMRCIGPGAVDSILEGIRSGVAGSAWQRVQPEVGGGGV